MQSSTDPTKLFALDPVWHQIRAEADMIVDAEPLMASFIFLNILSHETLEKAVVHRIAARLDHQDFPAETSRRLYETALTAQPELAGIFRADLAAVLDRDPACHRLIEPLLYFKGFAALQTQRLAHWLWNNKRKDLALSLQSRMSAAFGVDIHPAAKIGKGVMLDHGTGFTAGETCVIEDDVSILHGVTLGGNGKEEGDRHPKIRRGVLIGAGASILGNIEVGECARVAAGSVVIASVPCCTTVAGVPARVIGDAGCDQPARHMNHCFPCADFQI